MRLGVQGGFGGHHRRTKTHSIGKDEVNRGSLSFDGIFWDIGAMGDFSLIPGKDKIAQSAYVISRIRSWNKQNQTDE